MIKIIVQLVQSISFQKLKNLFEDTQFNIEFIHKSIYQYFVSEYMNVQIRYASKETYELGVCEVASSSGNRVRVYDKERSICNLIMDRNKVEVQNFQTAIKEYMSLKDKKIFRLIEYAEKLGIRDEVMKYVEGLV